jgi:branched-chain amino acid transport system permease protein
MTEFVVQTINGLTLAGVIFLVSSGFTLIFGVMRVTSLAHGAIFLLGGYVAYSVIEHMHNFFWGLAAGTLAMGALGLLVERGLLPLLRHSEMAELLATLGLVYVIDDVSLAIWGGNPLNITLPGVLNDSTTLPYHRIVYPNDRVGAIIRAGVDDRDMVSALGINVRIVFSAVFVLGTAMAGFAGVLGVPIVGLATGNDTTILLLALAVVVIGGLGSYEGSILGSVIIALADTYGTVYFPSVSYSVLFIPLVVILLVRPQGLLGRKATI